MLVNWAGVVAVTGLSECGAEPGMDIETVAREIVDACLRVHTRVGPGMLESAYEACMVHELGKRGLSVKKQVPLPLRYEEELIDIGYRIDLLVEDSVVLELKAVNQLLPIHTAQLLSYLRAGGYRLGFLLNFNTAHMRNGIKRLLNDPPRTTGSSPEDHADLGI
jgi:GxxExxY protein